MHIPLIPAITTPPPTQLDPPSLCLRVELTAGLWLPVSTRTHTHTHTQSIKSSLYYWKFRQFSHSAVYRLLVGRPEERGLIPPVENIYLSPKRPAYCHPIHTWKYFPVVKAAGKWNWPLISVYYQSYICYSLKAIKVKAKTSIPTKEQCITLHYITLQKPTG